MSKTISTIASSIKALGLAAVMFALVGAALAAPSASAATIGASGPGPLPQVGKLSLLAVDEAKGSAVSGATVVIYNADGVVVGKALTGANGSFATYLTPGIYKVKVFADGYKEFATVITVKAEQTTSVKAGLKSVNSVSDFRANS